MLGYRVEPARSPALSASFQFTTTFRLDDRRILVASILHDEESLAVWREVERAAALAPIPVRAGISGHEES
jgi:hypothetical protein